MHSFAKPTGLRRECSPCCLAINAVGLIKSGKRKDHTLDYLAAGRFFHSDLRSLQTRQIKN